MGFYVECFSAEVLTGEGIPNSGRFRNSGEGGEERERETLQCHNQNRSALSWAEVGDGGRGRGGGGKQSHKRCKFPISVYEIKDVT